MGNLIVPVDDRLYSTLQIGTESFPFLLSHDNLDNFQKNFVNWHNQTQIEISFVLEGKIKVCLLKEEHILTSGEAFVILPNHLHSIHPVPDEPGVCYTFIWDVRLLTGYPGSFFDRCYYEPISSSSVGFYRIPNSPEFSEVFTDMHWIYSNFTENDSSCFLPVQRRLQDIWIILFRHLFLYRTPAENKKEDSRILLMIQYLRNNYSDKFSLDKMAAAFHISRGECCRFFKKMMGLTISEYLLEYRLGKAAELLKHTSYTITDIAHEVGFNSISDFTARFRTKTGQTPGNYRKQENIEK